MSTQGAEGSPFPVSFSSKLCYPQPSDTRYPSRSQSIRNGTLTTNPMVETSPKPEKPNKSRRGPHLQTPY
ncbi:hypothetical protein JB92DRAFT_2969442 [Gautieria morchelliformis]|nr:hypothetical protein JB92DRAFT_2969377 [Gautieria morchelliformis]KAF8504029.1 hypothetical protein JB92DRAFT_2969442 [Gautieria morchelliformis]